MPALHPLGLMRRYETILDSKGREDVNARRLSTDMDIADATASAAADVCGAGNVFSCARASSADYHQAYSADYPAGHPATYPDGHAVAPEPKDHNTTDGVLDKGSIVGGYSR